MAPPLSSRNWIFELRQSLFSLFLIRVRVFVYVCTHFYFLMGRRGVMMIFSNDLHDQRERSRGARAVDLYFLLFAIRRYNIRTSFSLSQQTNTLICYLREEQTVVDNLFPSAFILHYTMKSWLKYLLLSVCRDERCLVMRGT